MQTPVFVPNPLPYLEFIKDVWEEVEEDDADPATLTEAYFEEELKPICCDFRRDIVLRRIAFDKAINHQQTQPVVDGLVEWLGEEINLMPDAERFGDYEYGDLCEQISYFAVKKITFQQFLIYLNDSFLPQPPVSGEDM